APPVAPGDIGMWIDPGARAVDIRVGVVDGMVTATVPVGELRSAATEGGQQVSFMQLRDHDNALTIIGSDPPDSGQSVARWPIGNGNLTARIGVAQERISTFDQLLLLLPLLMWIAAAIVTWLLVSRLLVRPLKRLEQSVRAYRPGEGALELPRKLGPSTEIQQLRDAFARAIDRAEESER